METAYQQAFKDLRKSQKNERELLKKHENLMGIAEEYADKFSSYREYQLDHTLRYVRIIYDHFIYNNAKLTFYLAKQDNADIANPIIDAMIADPRLEMIECPEKVLENSQTATWLFKPKDNKEYHPRLMVDVSYERSESCKLVPTGKFSEPYEITKMVCL